MLPLVGPRPAASGRRSGRRRRRRPGRAARPPGASGSRPRRRRWKLAWPGRRRCRRATGSRRRSRRRPRRPVRPGASRGRSRTRWSPRSPVEPFLDERPGGQQAKKQPDAGQRDEDGQGPGPARRRAAPSRAARAGGPRRGRRCTSRAGCRRTRRRGRQGRSATPGLMVRRAQPSAPDDAGRRPGRRTGQAGADRATVDGVPAAARDRRQRRPEPDGRRPAAPRGRRRWTR